MANLAPLEVTIVAQLKGFLDGLNQASGAVRGTVGELNRMDAAFVGLNGRMAAFGQQASSALTMDIMKGATMGNLLADAIRRAAQFAADLARETLGAGMEMEKISRMLDAATGNSAASMNFVRTVSAELGLELGSTAMAYAKLASAAKGTSLEGEQTQKLFKGITSASAVMGLSAEETSGAILALGQMMSKGRVAAEELRGQLGERIPGAFRLAAESMGVTTAEMDSLLQKGLSAEKFLPRFAETLNREFGEKAAGSADTLAANLNRLKGSWFDFQASLASGVMDAVKDGAKEFAEGLKSAAEWAQKNKPELGEIARTVMEIGRQIKGLVVDLVSATWGALGLGDGLKVVRTIAEGIGLVIAVIRDAIRAVMFTVASLASAIVSTVLSPIQAMLLAFANAMDFFSNGSGEALAKVAENLETVKTKTFEFSQGLWKPFQEGKNAIAQFGDELLESRDKAEELRKKLAEGPLMDGPESSKAGTGGKGAGSDKATADKKIEEELKLLIEQTTTFLQMEKTKKDMLQSVADLERRVNEDHKALAAENRAHDQEMALLRVDGERETLDHLNAMGKVTMDQALNQAIYLEQERLRIRKQGLEDQMKALQDSGELSTLAEAKILNQMAKLDADYLNRRSQLENQAAEERAQAFRDMIQPLTQAFEQSLQGMLAGTMTFSQGLRGIWQGVSRMVDQFITRMVMSWVFGEQTKTAATSAGVLQRLAMETWGAMKSVALAIWTGLKWIAVKAWEAAAGAYSAIASIPYVGPFLAPAVAAATMIAVMGMASNLASAAGGWDKVPSDQVAQLHKNEMVLSAPLAQGIRELVANGQTGGTGEVHHHHYSIQAMDSRSFEDALRRNQGALVRVTQDAVRNRRLG